MTCAVLYEIDPEASSPLGFEVLAMQFWIERYEAALRADDDYATAHFNLSAAYKKMGRHADAVREFRRSHRVKKRRIL